MNATQVRVSRFSDAIRWLIDHLADHPSLFGVNVTEGWQVDGHAESLIIGRVRLDQDWQQLGARTRDETMIVELWVYVAREGATAEEISSRANEIGDAVAAVLRSSRESIAFDGLCAWSSLIPIMWTPGVLPDGRDGMLQLELRLSNVRFA